MSFRRDIRSFFSKAKVPPQQSLADTPNVSTPSPEPPSISSRGDSDNGKGTKPNRLQDSGYISSTEPPNDNKVKRASPAPEEPRLNTSFASSGGSSQRVMRHGEVVVTNSDEDDDSESSLMDVEELLGRKKKVEPPPPSSSPLTDSSELAHKLERYEEQERRSEWLRVPARKKRKVMLSVQEPRKYKFSLDALVESTEADEAVEMGVAIARSTFEHSERMAGAGGGIADADAANVNQELLASVAESREDMSMERVGAALARTEALQREKSWSFFDYEGSTTASPSPDFPVGALKGGEGVPEYFKKTLTGKFSDKGRVEEETVSDVKSRART